MNNWILTKTIMPEAGQFVIVNIRDGNHIYCEILKVDEKSKRWTNRDDKDLPPEKNVTAWMNLPPALID